MRFRLNVLVLISTFALGLQFGCLDLDGYAHSGRHCSIVDESLCEDEEDVWDRVCKKCDEPYDFAAEYPWMPSTVTSTDAVRPIPKASIQRFQIATADKKGSLDTYFITSHGEEAKLTNTTILYSHGNSTGIEHYIPRLQFLYEGGYNLLVWDYRGYGKSEPSTAPTPTEWNEDARLIRDWVATSTVIPNADKVISYGNSLGGIPAVEMSIHKTPCALIMEAAFTSISAIARTNATIELPETFLSQGHYNNVGKIKDYTGPLFAMIGSEDIKFPVEDIQEMVNNAPNPKKELWVLEGVNHGISNGGVPEAGLQDYLDRMLGFLEKNAPECLN